MEFDIPHLDQTVENFQKERERNLIEHENSKTNKLIANQLLDDS